MDANTARITFGAVRSLSRLKEGNISDRCTGANNRLRFKDFQYSREVNFLCQFFSLGGSQPIFLLFRPAELAHETLGDNHIDGGHKEKWFGAHIEHSRDGGPRRVGVECREHEVARERGVDRKICRLFVADFSHHNNVGVLPHEGTQAGGKGHTNVRLDLRLVDARHLVLNRVLNSGDVDVRFVQNIQNGVERG